MSKKVENNDRNMGKSILNYLHNESLDPDPLLEEKDRFKITKDHSRRMKSWKKNWRKSNMKKRLKRYKKHKKKIY